MKKINIIFMALAALSTQCGVASEGEDARSAKRQRVEREQNGSALSSTDLVIQNRREPLSPYQRGIADMVNPFIPVVSVAQLTAAYLGKSEYEEYRAGGKVIWRNLEKILKERPKMYINSFDVDTTYVGSNPILHDIVENNHLHALKKLLVLKPNVNAPNSLGKKLYVFLKKLLFPIYAECIVK